MTKDDGQAFSVRFNADEKREFLFLCECLGITKSKLLKLLVSSEFSRYRLFYQHNKNARSKELFKEFGEDEKK